MGDLAQGRRRSARTRASARQRIKGGLGWPSEGPLHLSTAVTRHRSGMCHNLPLHLSPTACASPKYPRPPTLKSASRAAAHSSRGPKWSRSVHETDRPGSESEARALPDPEFDPIQE